MLVMFFFSSRRRHTRWPRDWSSDVCSSDLVLHDGSVDTLRNFHEAPVFSLNATQEGQLEQFMLVFPTDLAPIVGQQVTLSSTNGGVVNARIDLFETRAGTAFTSLMLGGNVTECDV